MLREILTSFSSRTLALFGWKVEGEMPSLPKFVIIIGHHTSNWDFPLNLMANFKLNLYSRWYAKHSIFVWPLGVLWRKLGGIPIDRRKAFGFTERAIHDFKNHDEFKLAIAPEGTRKKVQKWKTGFYQIALGAGVPVVPVAMDYPTKRIIVGAAFMPTGDSEGDIRKLQNYFAPYRGLYPEYEMDLPSDRVTI